MARLYWSVCGLLLAAGVGGMALIVLVPPEQLDAAGNVIGEMPPAFGAALGLAGLGLMGLLAGLALLGVMRLW